MKLIELSHPTVGKLIYFYCPGCKRGHAYEVPRWEFNGDFDKPTFSPSLLVFYTNPETKQRVTCCHLHVRNGNIEYCDDSPHELKGQTVPIPEWPEGYGKPGESH